MGKQPNKAQIRFNQPPGWQYNENSRFRGFLKFTKEEALEDGQSHYWSWQPCKYGHVGWLVTETDQCVHCHREDLKKAQHAKRLHGDLRTPDYNAKARAIIEIEKRNERKRDQVDIDLGWD